MLHQLKGQTHMPLPDYTAAYTVNVATRDPDGKTRLTDVDATISIDMLRLVTTMAARAAARPNRRSTLGNGMIQVRVDPPAKAKRK
jgi:hypothetical protein